MANEPGLLRRQGGGNAALGGEGLRDGINDDPDVKYLCVGKIEETGATPC